MDTHALVDLNYVLLTVKSKMKRPRPRKSSQKSKRFRPSDSSSIDNRYDSSAQHSSSYKLPKKWDDEDILSDEVWDEEDEEKFGELLYGLRSKLKRPKVDNIRAKTESEDEVVVSISEDSNEDDTLHSSDPDTMQLSEMLDFHSEDDSTNIINKMEFIDDHPSNSVKDEADESSSESVKDQSDSHSNSGTDESEHSGSSNDEDSAPNDEQHSKLLSLLKDLPSDPNPNQNTDRKQSKYEEIDPVLAESEFAAINSSTLTVSDLIGGLKSRQKSKQSKKSKSLKLIDQSTIAQIEHTLSKAQSNPNARLLLPRVNEVEASKQTRKMAYEDAKTHISVWQPVIQQREDLSTKHFPVRQTKHVNTTNKLVASFQPSNSLEEDLEQLRKHYELSTDQLTQAENTALEERNYSPDEIRKRQAELARMKSLLFYEELKAKRINKVKSKLFKKLHRKQPSEMTEEELASIRARERMTLQHTSSAYIKRQILLAKNSHNPNSRQTVQEQLNKAQQLKRKIAGIEFGDDNEENLQTDESSSSEEEIEGVCRTKESRAKILRKQLDKMKALVDKEAVSESFGSQSEMNVASGMSKQKGLFGLKFMQRALERQKEQTREMIKEFEIEAKEILNEDGEESEQNQQNQSELKVRNPIWGRFTITPSNVTSLSHSTEQSDDQKLKLVDSTFQSAKVALSMGHKTAMSGNITVKTDEDQIEDNVEEKVLVLGNAKNESINDFFFAQSDTNKSKVQISTIQSNETNSANSTQSQNIMESNSQIVKSKHIQSKKSKLSQTDQSHSAVDEEPNPWALDTKPSKSKPKSKSQTITKNNENAINKSSDINEKKTTKITNGKVNNLCVKPINSTADTISSNSTKSNAKSLKSNSIEANTSNSQSSNIRNSSLLSSDEKSDSENEINLLSSATQRDLVTRAFATDSATESDFVKQKMELIQNELSSVLQRHSDTQSSGVIPGWGNWVGDGAPKRKLTAKQRRKIEENTRKLAQITKQALDSRRDAKLSKVVISEQTDRKLNKYLVPQIPFPFTNEMEYSHSLSQPMGNEWNTLNSHQKSVAPQIITRMGTVIEPMKLSKIQKLKADELIIKQQIEDLKEKKQIVKRKLSQRKPLLS